MKRIHVCIHMYLFGVYTNMCQDSGLPCLGSPFNSLKEDSTVFTVPAEGVVILRAVEKVSGGKALRESIFGILASCFPEPAAQAKLQEQLPPDWLQTLEH